MSRASSLVASTLLVLPVGAAAVAAQIPDFVTLDNGHARLEFSTDVNHPTFPGTSLDLDSIQRLNGVLDPIAMSKGTGKWTLRLVMKRPEYPGAGSCADPGGNEIEWFDVSMDGSTDRWNPSGPDPLGNLDAFSFDDLQTFTTGNNVTMLRADWSGQVTLEGESTGFTVTTWWTMVPGKPLCDTSLDVTLTAPGTLGFYVSHVLYPHVEVYEFDAPEDTLLIPFISGNLVTNPTDPANPFPPELGWRNNHYPANVMAYYDNEPDSNCFYLTTTDANAYWKEVWMRPVGTIAPRMTFTFRNFPDDIYEKKTYSMPYAGRMGAIQGDWWDVVATYRQFLENDVPWYRGPIGSPANPMPLVAKKLVGEVLFQTLYHGDHMDILSRQMMDLTRIMGPNVNTIWYHGFAPDEFSHWFWKGGYLPGRPSFVGAVREGQKQYDHVIAPYVNSSMAADHLDPEVPNPPPPTQLLLDLADAFLLDEDLQEAYICSPAGPPRSGILCPGAPFWQDFFVEFISEIGTFTDMNGVYLDFFLTYLCYSDEHGPGFVGDPRGHAPGGGRWMHDNRMQQVRDLKAQLRPDFAVSIEFVKGRWTEEAHVMHVNPANNLLSAEDHPGTTTPKPMENAVTVPFFRALYDNVKLSRITLQNPELAGRRAWIEANNVFAFGGIPGITRVQPELTPIFSERFAFASFYNYLSSLAFPSIGGSMPATTPSNDDGEFPTYGDIEFTPQDLAFNAPYFRYLSKTTRVLCEYDFLRWHNGTIRKIPVHQVHDVPGFTGIPGVELDPDPPQTNTPVYQEEHLVTGMFQAPRDLIGPDAGSLAFVVTNPWVDPTQQATFEIDFAFQPGLYPAWTGTTLYSITRYDAEGNVTPVGGVFQGPWISNASVPPGGITWWVFRKL